MEKSKSKEIFSVTWAGLVLFAIIFSFFTNGVMRFVNPVALLFIGFALGMAAWALYRGEVLARRDGVLVAFVIGGAALAGVGIFGTRAIYASAETDKRCLALQAKFVDTPQPDDKAAAAFSALGCRPQFARSPDKMN